MATQDAVQAPTRKKRYGVERLLHDLVHRRQRFRQLVGALFIFGMALAGRPTFTLFLVGAGLTVFGMAVRMWASGCVKKNTVLATNGPYALVRHPLYVGNVLICAGFCFASGLWWSIPLALATLLLFYPHAIRYEDKKLRGFFTEQWDAWGPKTPALLPRMSNWSGVKGAEWSLHQSLIKNGEPIYVAIMTACLILLWVRLG
jgi:protein-S-isoprenylcysteine O-methyltransferase Ste14